MSRNKRPHPLESFFGDLSRGVRPTPQELDDLAHLMVDSVEGSSYTFPSLRAKLRDEAKNIVALYEGGSFGEARAEASRLSDKLVHEFAAYVTPDPDAGVTDGQALIANVPRSGGPGVSNNDDLLKDVPRF